MKVISDILRLRAEASAPVRARREAYFGGAPRITLGEARSIVASLAPREAVLLLSPPGVGKSEMVQGLACAVGLPCRSLVGTQIAAEDVSGIPRIVGERSVFCPPRVLLPEDNKPFCLFLDELPSASADVQKALYALLLERRLGEHRLPEGTWVVAAGNRAEDHALVGMMSSALVNRAVVLHVEPDVDEWLAWATGAGIRADVLGFLSFFPDALSRPAPSETAPFSTPRSWAALSRSLERLAAGGDISLRTRRALAFGLVSSEDAELFCSTTPASLRPPDYYLRYPVELPASGLERWLAIESVRSALSANRLACDAQEADAFLCALTIEERFTAVVGLVEKWQRRGANRSFEELCAQVRAA